MVMTTRKVLRASYEEALGQVPAALKAEGFGVITEIDMQRTLEQKLGVDFRRYTILGACNPPLALEALETDLEIGLMLPCNVVVYEDDAHHAVVLAIDPRQMMAASGNPRLVALAEKVTHKLSAAMARLES
jgi:uncharacterized protein (DUF302 family)